MATHVRSCLVLLLALALAATSCGSDDAADGGRGPTRRRDDLTMAVTFTSEVDPDIYFDLELAAVTNGVYEGLVRYRPGATDIEGVLAESWEISADGRTYTFTLREGTSFADGSPIDSHAVLAAFERRTALAGPPAYLLLSVEGYETPDDRTFVIHLRQPANNFLDRLASPSGPLITNPAVIAAHDTDGDLARGWLGTHSAGSGPYVIEEFVPDDRIVLVRNDRYWSDPPAIPRVVLRVVPDSISQQLQVEQGDIDLIQGVSPETAAQIQAEGELTVDSIQGLAQAFVQVNVAKPPFDRPEVARAFAASIDRAQLVADVFGDYGEVAHQTAPAGVMPEGLARFDPDHDPDALAEVTAGLPKDTTITLATPIPDPRHLGGRVNDALAEILRGAGYTTQILELPIVEYFSFIGAPDRAPHLIFSVQPGDGAAPANWYELFMTTTGALNVGGTGTPEADAFIQAGNSPPAPADPDYQSYSDASDLIVAQGSWIPIADTPTVYVHPDDLLDVHMHLTLPPAVWLQDLRWR